jgi:FkbM family methyltransferase
MINIIKIIKRILLHPLNSEKRFAALLRFLKWQIGSRLVTYPILYQFTENSKLQIVRGLTGATGNLYCGLDEFQDMGFLLHFLRPNDIFVDIGANVGSYTVLSSAEIGAKTISVEPVPVAYKYLKENVYVNNLNGLVETFNICLGSTTGRIKFTKSLDTVNHVALGNELDIIEVPVKRLDDVLGGKSPILLKVDVEGYELEVLRGANKTLSNLNLKALIVELNGSGSKYGFKDIDVHNDLISRGFLPYSYNPFNREILKLDTYGKNNTIYLRDEKLVSDRLTNSRKIRINSNEI